MLPVTQSTTVRPAQTSLTPRYVAGRRPCESRSRVIARAHQPMGLSIGIVGLPNVGKSTLFNALSSAKAEAANYPFCTIEPNVGVVAVPDARLNALDSVVHADRIVPATIDFGDIPGLVGGGHKGEWLGNQLLAHIRD